MENGPKLASRILEKLTDIQYGREESDWTITVAWIDKNGTCALGTDCGIWIMGNVFGYLILVVLLFILSALPGWLFPHAREDKSQLSNDLF